MANMSKRRTNILEDCVGKYKQKEDKYFERLWANMSKMRKNVKR